MKRAFSATGFESKIGFPAIGMFCLRTYNVFPTLIKCKHTRFSVMMMDGGTVLAREGLLRKVQG